MMKMYVYVKRILDFICALTLLIIFSPILVLIAVLIKLDSKGPALFQQDRLGQNLKVFKVYKFRTMIDNAENIGSGIYTDSSDPRITRMGSLLRKTSLDEIPQLINIIKGEMSFIGPRPVPVEHLESYNVGDPKRIKLKPGISGWAQVNGRNSLTWPEKVEKDIWYSNNISFFLDGRIFFKTVQCILLGDGVYSGRYADIVKNNKGQVKKDDLR